MKERLRGALALEHVTGPWPGLVDCPWTWDSLHPSAKLGQACRGYDCVHEDSPLVQLGLKRLSRNIPGEMSSSNMPLPTPCLFCCSFLPFASGCILGKKTTGAFSSLSQNPLMQEPCLHRGPSCSKGYHLSNRVRQDGRWACCWGVDLVPEMEDPQAVSCQGK